MADCVSWPAAQEAPEKRPQAATCQQSFVKLGLMAYPAGCQNPPAKMAARGSITKARGVLGVIGPLPYCDSCIIKRLPPARASRCLIRGSA